MNVVVFACVHNAGRSQMAAAVFNALADPGQARAVSAGTEPAEHVHPEVVRVMRERGIDLSSRKPQRLTDELARSASMLITMGCGEACPVVPGLVREDWPLPDPKGRPLEEVRQIRAEIAARVRVLLEAKGWSRARIRAAHAGDRDAVLALLRAAELPTEGVDSHFATFMVAHDPRSPQALSGVVGLEIRGEHALLRSLAVGKGVQHHGIGSALVGRQLGEARRHGVQHVYLLTTTASEFFAKLGFERIDRSQVPDAIATSPEFAYLCPESAVAMYVRT